MLVVTVVAGVVVVVVVVVVGVVGAVTGVLVVSVVGAVLVFYPMPVQLLIILHLRNRRFRWLSSRTPPRVGWPVAIVGPPASTRK